MAAQFTTTGDWHGTLKSGYEKVTQPAGKSAAPDGYLWQRKIYKVDRKRFGQTMTGYPDTTGNTAAGNTIYVKNGGDTIYGNAAQTYVLEIDFANPSPMGSGIWEETQRMTAYTDWALWELPAPPAP